MNATLKIFFFTLLVAVLGSCTIQKRTFNKGYYVEWNRKLKKQEGHSTETERTDKVYVETDEKSVSEEKSAGQIPDTLDRLSAEQSVDMPVEEEPREELQNPASERKEQKQASKPGQENKMKPLMYNRGNGGNVLLGLCTLVMICICMAMISYLFSAEATFGAILLILCFGWILIVFTIILIVLFIVRFVRNF